MDYIVLPPSESHFITREKKTLKLEVLEAGIVLLFPILFARKKTKNSTESIQKSNPLSSPQAFLAPQKKKKIPPAVSWINKAKNFTPHVF